MGAEVVLDTTEAEALTAFRKALRIIEDPFGGHCGCLGALRSNCFLARKSSPRSDCNMAAISAGSNGSTTPDSPTARP